MTQHLNSKSHRNALKAVSNTKKNTKTSLKSNTASNNSNDNNNDNNSNNTSEVQMDPNKEDADKKNLNSDDINNSNNSNNNNSLGRKKKKEKMKHYESSENNINVTVDSEDDAADNLCSISTPLATVSLNEVKKQLLAAAAVAHHDPTTSVSSTELGNSTDKMEYSCRQCGWAGNSKNKCKYYQL